MTSERKTSNKQRVIAASLLGVSACADVGAPVSGHQTRWSEATSAAGSGDIGRAVQHQIDEKKIPGAVVMISDHGVITHSMAYGVSSLESSQPLRGDDIFRLYSMTKPITCAAVLTLLEAGKIGLDDPVAKHLPEFQEMKVRTEAGLFVAGTPITVRHLLTHTSGLSYEILPTAVSADYAQADVFAIRNRRSENLEQHVKRLAQLPLAAQPGSTWNYGESMGVLGRIVEVTTGKSFRSYLKEHVLDPLRMVDTDFYVAHEKAGRLTQLYLTPRSGGLLNAADNPQFGGSYLEKPSLEYGGAGLVGTARDYMNFAEMLLNKGEFGGKRILSADSVRMMTSNQLDDRFGEQPLAASGRAPGVGFGFCGYVVATRSESSPPGNVGEYGWGGWASTTFWIDPEKQRAGVVLTQVIPEDIGSVTLTDDIRKLIYAR
jgi:CubicO group peptidase (beta-lactamase class C family)